MVSSTSQYAVHSGFMNSLVGGLPPDLNQIIHHNPLPTKPVTPVLPGRPVITLPIVVKPPGDVGTQGGTPGGNVTPPPHPASTGGTQTVTLPNGQIGTISGGHGIATGPIVVQPTTGNITPPSSIGGTPGGNITPPPHPIAGGSSSGSSSTTQTPTTGGASLVGTGPLVDALTQLLQGSGGGIAGSPPTSVDPSLAAVEALQPQAAPTTSTGNSALLIVIVGIVGIGAWLWWSHRKKKPDGQR